MDPCLVRQVKLLNWRYRGHYRTLGSCCGHGRYPKTVVVQDLRKQRTFELFSEKDIPRKKRFYRRDRDGVYYIPEVSKAVR